MSLGMRWFEPNRRRQHAVVMKLVDISDLKSGDRNVVWVQLPSAAPMGIWWNVDTPVLETGDRDVVRVRVSLSPPIIKIKAAGHRLRRHKYSKEDNYSGPYVVVV